MAENMNTVRSYEVSIWTLQDRFLSVLKWANMDCKGQIQEPEVVLRDDGMQECTFSIPKFYWLGANRMDNPMWLHLQNQPLEANMHKLKVIFNKNTEDEKVFEFLVTEVTHDHSSDNVDLTVKSEGLAFHELGKIGYKISLSEQNYIDALEEWEQNGMSGTQPLNNIQFWNDLIFKDADGNWKTNWDYRIEMDWSSFSTQVSSQKKLSDVLYEDEYVTAWELNSDDKLLPRAIQNTRQKCRIIEEKESNIYNLTQTIAEQFGVFCRYEYEYNENYQIIGRHVIYYNNYLYDVYGHVDLTYPYSSSAVTRTVDSSNITSKMYVSAVDYDSNLVTIMDLDANKSGEDYLLNFDYLHDIQAISDEQYAEIPEYEKQMHTLNTTLSAIQERIRIAENQLTEAKARKTTYENAIGLDQERDQEAGKLRAALTGGTNVIPINGTPCTVLSSDERGFYINIRWEGLERGTLRLYQTSDFTGDKAKFKDIVTQYNFAEDEYHNVIRVEHITAPKTLSAGDTLWAKGYYNPTLAYDKVQAVWKQRLAYDQAELNKATAEVEKFTYYLEGDKNNPTLVSDACPNLLYQEKELIAQKEALISKFERMMGPALREGYWNPENYHDYGDLFSDSLEIGYNNSDIKQGKTAYLKFMWDGNKYYENEEPLIYTADAEGNMNQHLVIDISDQESLKKISKHLDDLCFVYCNPSNVATIDEIKGKIQSDPPITVENANEWIAALQNSMYFSYRIGSGCELGWVRSGNTRKPVLIVTGVKELDDDTVNFIQTNTYTVSIVDVDSEKIQKVTDTAGKEAKSFIGYPQRDSNGNIIPNAWEKIKTVGGDSNAFIGTRKVPGKPTPQNYTWVREYPRFYFNTLKLKKDSVTIIRNSKLLKEYEDYYTVSDDRSTGLTSQGIGYYVTLKPEILFAPEYTDTNNITIAYSLSNLDIAIYLDAIKIMNENARPKVTYDLELSLLNPDFVHTAYNRLNQIVHINDNDLQLENVSGYISTVTMKLDRFWEDTVEVQNYTTKFEDLFSNIVAQTAAMQRNGGVLAALTSGNLSLSSGTIQNAIYNNTSIFDAYLDSYFDSSQVVKDKLRELFTEAGEILGASDKLLNRIGSLALRNSEILSGFVYNIASELTPKTTYSQTKPDNYKIGDVWIQLDENGKEVGRYVATSDSTGESSFNGFTRTYDGTLAAITGASLDVDAVEGIVNILAHNEINIKSGGDIDIFAKDNVNIVGNQAVNIGGTTINIGSATLDDGSTYTGGINLVAASYNEIGDKKGNASISKVLISPTKIEMGSSTILMKSNSRITLQASTGTYANTSVIDISAEEGIYVGSGNGIRLYSGSTAAETYVGPNHKARFQKGDYWVKTSTVGGHMTYDDYFKSAVLYTQNTSDLPFTIEGVYVANGNWNEYYTSPEASDANSYTTTGWTSTNISPVSAIKSNGVYGVSVEMVPEHLIFGYSNIQKKIGSALQVDEAGIIMATGQAAATDIAKNITGTSTGLTGAKFTKDSIGFATGSGSNINAILMNNNGITIGSGSIDVTQTTSVLRNITAGSYVRVASNGIDIGSLANLYINSNNFKLQTDTYANGAQKTGLDNTIFAIGSNLNGITANTNPSTITGSNVDLLLNKNGLYIRGTVEASAFKANATNGYFLANGASLGFYDNNNNAIMTISGSTVTVNQNLSIQADNMYLSTAPTGTIFGVGADIGKPTTNLEDWVSDGTRTGFLYNSGSLYIKGKFFSEAGGRIGGWNITDSALSGNQLIFLNGTETFNGSVYNSGIYLANGNVTDALKVVYGGQTYYAYEDSNHNIYYIRSTTSSYTVTDGNKSGILQYLPTLVAVSPKYTKTVQKQAVLSDGTATEVLYVYNDEYVADSDRNEVLYNNSPILYNSQTSPAASWYVRLKAAVSDVGLYANHVYSETTSLQPADISTGTTLTKVSAHAVTFSVRATDGYMTVDNGRMGNFDLNSGGLLNGTLSNSKIISCDIDNYSSSYYGTCFYDVAIDNKAGTITLYRINQTPVVINLTQMEALQAKIVQQSTPYTVSEDTESGTTYVDNCDGKCTGTCKNTCGGGCSGTCSQACADDCTGGCTAGCTGGCEGGCKGTCSSGCQGSCKTQCAVACGNNCGSDCANSCEEECVYECGSTCSKGCSASCADNCTGGCKDGCKGTCTTTCAQNCGNNCGTTCANDCSGDCSGFAS